ADLASAFASAGTAGADAAAVSPGCAAGLAPAAAFSGAVIPFPAFDSTGFASADAPFPFSPAGSLALSSAFFSGKAAALPGAGAPCWALSPSANTCVPEKPSGSRKERSNATAGFSNLPRSNGHFAINEVLSLRSRSLPPFLPVEGDFVNYVLQEFGRTAHRLKWRGLIAAFLA